MDFARQFIIRLLADEEPVVIGREAVEEIKREALRQAAEELLDKAENTPITGNYSDNARTGLRWAAHHIHPDTPDGWRSR